MKKFTDPSSEKSRDNPLWSVLFVLIAAATIWAVISRSRAFSLPAFASYIGGASAPWLAAAAAGMLGFIFFEGEALAAVCRTFGYPVRRRSGFAYAASDIYFSAITPSATGGQPACAYFMMRDGIPGVVTTTALLVNLTMYTIAILVLGVLTLLARPEIFLSFGPLSRALIVLGYFTQGALATFFLLLLRKGDLLHKICRTALHLLCKIKLLRHEEEKRRKLAQSMREYAAYARLAAAHKGMLAKVLAYNVLQRACVISVSLFVFLSCGGAPARAAEAWAVQCYTIVGSNTIPIPGAMGVTDYMLLEGFGGLLPQQSVVNFELLSRSLSFYVCVLVCAITALIKYAMQRKRRSS